MLEKVKYKRGEMGVTIMGQLKAQTKNAHWLLGSEIQ